MAKKKNTRDYKGRKRKAKEEKALVPAPPAELGLPSFFALLEEFKPLIEEMNAQIEGGAKELEEVKLDLKDEMTTPQRRDKASDLIIEAEDFSLALRAKGKKLYEYARWCDRIAEQFKFGLKTHMEIRGIKSIEGFTHRLVVCKNPASVQVYDPEALPEEYVSRPAVPDKAAIKDALLDGEEIDGANLSESTRLEVK
jgi:hypothetical protein